MKRSGNLYGRIAEKENLALAFWKAQRGKSDRNDVIAFRQNLDRNIVEIRDDLLNNRLLFGNYHIFTILDPKKRNICAADFRERVIQHAVVNVCEKIFEKYQIFDSYACRKNKGLDRCLARTRTFCRRFPFYLKLDIRKFFDTVDHRILLQFLNRRFKDQQLMNLFSNLLGSYETSQGCGLPIGNLLSQYFANHYLGFFDHEIKDHLRISGYVRYMDDFILFIQDVREAHILLPLVTEFLKTKLNLQLNAPVLNKTAHGIPFLNYQVYPDKLRLSLKSKRRFKKKIAEVIAQNDEKRCLPLLAFVERAQSFGFRKSVFYGKTSQVV